MLIKTLRAAWLALGLAMMMLGSPPAHAAADTAICYNCPPEWADWGTQLQAIAADIGVHVPPDSKNSGQSLSALSAERHNPMADVVYYGVTFGIQAAEQGLVQPYKPAHWDAIPDGMKDPEGKWFAVHSGTLGFMVNVDALHGVPVPQSWRDLLKPEYRTMVGYLDPGSAFVGYVAAVAVNRALGGTLDDFTPAIEWFQKLQANSPIVPRQTAYARVLSGEIPILLDYDFNAYRARYQDHTNVRFVIPQEGTISVPYVMSLVADDPNPTAARNVLDYVLSDKGQAIWADAYLRPVRANAISQRALRRFLPASDYARADTVDYAKMAAAQRGFAKRYAAEVQ